MEVAGAAWAVAEAEKALAIARKRNARNSQLRREREEVLKSLGMTRVRSASGREYWE